MLFIEQPVQVGYSYDVLTNVTVNLGHHEEDEHFIKPANFSNGVPEQNNTFLVGTMSSQKDENTANSTQHAATALWHFAQTWFVSHKIRKGRSAEFAPGLRSSLITSLTTKGYPCSQKVTVDTMALDSSTTSFAAMRKSTRALFPTKALITCI